MKKIIIGVISVISLSVIGYAESCSSAGQVQYKPSGSCGTSTRKCCNSKVWSEWDKDCPTCSSGQCWNGSKCESKVNKCAEGNAAAVYDNCSSEGWVYYCTCNGASWGQYKNGDTVPMCKSCSVSEPASVFQGFGSTALANLCNSNGSVKGYGSYFGRYASSPQEACSQRMRDHWKTLSPKVNNSDEIPSGSCAYFGNDTGGYGGAILSLTPAATGMQISTSDYGHAKLDQDCNRLRGNFSSYNPTIYCVGFYPNKTCC